MPVDISNCRSELDVRNSIRHLETLRRIDPQIDTLIKGGFRFLTNAGSDEISRLVGEYGGLQNVHLSKAYTTDAIHLPNSIGVWIRGSIAA